MCSNGPRLHRQTNAASETSDAARCELVHGLGSRPPWLLRWRRRKKKPRTRTRATVLRCGCHPHQLVHPTAAPPDRQTLGRTVNNKLIDCWPNLVDKFRSENNFSCFLAAWLARPARLDMSSSIHSRPDAAASPGATPHLAAAAAGGATAAPAPVPPKTSRRKQRSKQRPPGGTHLPLPVGGSGSTPAAAGPGETCDHSAAIMRGRCSRCGATVDRDLIVYEYGHHRDSMTSFTEQGATRLHATIENRLLRERKLVLALDLDSCVIQATTRPEEMAVYDLWLKGEQELEALHALAGVVAAATATATVTATARAAAASAGESLPAGAAAAAAGGGNEAADALERRLHCFTLRDGSASRRYAVKVRPGVYNFLHNLKHLYEIHLYTHA
jgi:hypothetical protein